MSEGRYLGIDFGTTNSAMAFYDPKEGRAEIVLNDDDQATTPSAVYYAQDGEVLVGQDALNALADDASSTDPNERDEASKRLQRATKRRLLNPPIIPIPGREPVRPAEVVSEVLKKLKRDAEEGHFGEEVGRAVITCPAEFKPKERKVLREAAVLAGFREVELFEEPTAAAVAVHERGQRIGKGVLVYDLGAGTFDLAVVVREEDGSFREAMKSVGDARCGGNDFDLALYYHCEEVAREELDRPISLTGELDQAFLGECRLRKENLSKNNRSRFSSFLAKAEGGGGTERFVHEVERGTFEGLIRGRVEETVRRTAGLLEQAERQGHEVETVVLIGGSSKVPLVKTMLGEALPVEPRKFAGKTHAVALGAAYRAFELWGSGRGKASEHVDEGRALFEQGRYQEAVDVLDRALSIDPDNAKAWRGRGVALGNLGRHQEALEASDRALRIDPNDAKAWNNKGRMLGSLGRYQEALEAYERALSIDPDHAVPWFFRGLALENLGRPQEALDAYERALRIDPNKPAFWNNKGNALNRLGRHQEALEACDRALVIAPEHANAWLGRGIALDNLGHRHEALEAFDRALRIDPNDAKAWNNKGVVLRNLGRFRKALEAYDRALGIAPNFAAAWTAKGRALRGLGRHQEALEAHKRALSIDPNNVDAWHGKGLALEKLGRHEEAREADYERVSRINPNDATGWERKGHLLYSLGRHQEALEAYEQALGIAPDHAHAWNNKGNALHSLGRYQEALEAYERALSIDPNYAEARSNKDAALRTSSEGKWRHAGASADYETGLTEIVAPLSTGKDRRTAGQRSGTARNEPRIQAPLFSISFGTTNSSMAWYHPEKGKAEIIPSAEGASQTPSLVLYDEDEILVGDVVQNLIEDSEYFEEEKRTDVARRVVTNILRNLSHPSLIPIPGYGLVRPVEAVSEILKKLKRDAESHFFEEVERVVITYPALLDVHQRRVLSDAAIAAGFRSVELLEEPVAVALAAQRIASIGNKGALIYDLGAAAFDLSVVSRDQDGVPYIPVVPTGAPCGGDDFDLALYHHCDRIAREQLYRPISLTGDVDPMFLRTCRHRKEWLSSGERSRFSSFLPSFNDSPARFSYEIDRVTFEGLIRDQVEKTVRMTVRMFEQVQDKVDTVIAVGGSSRVPLVQRRLKETLPVQPRSFDEIDHAAALGAAYHAYDLWMS